MRTMLLASFRIINFIYFVHNKSKFQRIKQLKPEDISLVYLYFILYYDVVDHCFEN